MPIERGKRHQRQSRDSREAKNRGAQRSVRDRGIVGERRHADGVEIGDSESDQNRHDHRPGIAEPYQPFQQRAESPGQHDGLNADVGGGMMNHPILEPLEISREHQRVEDNQAPERDPVDHPNAREPAVKIGLQRAAQRRVPYQTPMRS